nr:immunoglobulin heavy chain junction region [Macaca mulatta]MOX06492.1 immunoglobulin heavy chain junction region [Macaca mulatta]
CARECGALCFSSFDFW